MHDLRTNQIRGQNDGGGYEYEIPASEIDSGSLLVDLGGYGRLCQIDVHPTDRKRFLTSGVDGIVRLFDMRAIYRNSHQNIGFNLSPHYQASVMATGAAFDDSGDRIAVSILTGSVHVLNASMTSDIAQEEVGQVLGMRRSAARRGPPIRGEIVELSGHISNRTIKAVNWLGDFVVTGSDDGRVWIYDSYTREPVNVLEGHKANVNVVAVHREKKLLATSGVDHFSILWEPRAIADVKRGMVQEKVRTIQAEGFRRPCPVM
jgi:WD40 repeat protein